MAVTHYVYDGQNVHKELDGIGATQAAYTYEPSTYGNLISQRRDSSTSYYHQDALGSTRELTNASETRTDTYVYSAWGESLLQSGETVNPFRWIGNVGYYYDEESSDYYVRARYYLPAKGRWVSRDPLVYMEDTNAYAYVVATPLLRIDPSGLQSAQSTLEATSLSCQQIGGEYPCDCRGDLCVFELTINFHRGLPPIGPFNQLCFKQLPGELRPNQRPEDVYECHSEINRATKGDFFSFKLKGGTICRYEDSNFPPDSPVPKHEKEECNQAIVLVDIDGRLPNQGGCYSIGTPADPVIEMEVDFSMEVKCGCDYSGTTSDYLRLKAKFT